MTLIESIRRLMIKSNPTLIAAFRRSSRADIGMNRY